ncbi:sensor histidine kinase [Jingyaoa shaoxingensis]|uniref:histidine kinase n=1 Tax=Jingyaoa shaoxingensis TaxID=2763671 RepID=A0ABR7N6Q0_9FIRM|nr:HAMP domain-containing sensor histidine kinase [Jingyaoa shaoxingensis]MBC8572072.1 HAMP domain-containing histidine kinase [Jingyaoa shaoxingensis]
MKNIKLRIVYLILGSALLLSALFVLAVNVIIPSHFVNEAKKALLNEAEYQNRAIPYTYDEPDYDENWEEGYFFTPSIVFLELEDGYRHNTWNRDTYRLEKKLLEYCAGRDITLGQCYTLKTDRHHLIFMSVQEEQDDWEKPYAYIMYIDIGPITHYIVTLNWAFFAVLLAISSVMCLLGFLFGRDIEKEAERQQTFFQNASHELKTPLMAIQGYAEGIQAGVMDTGSAAEVILKESDRMTELVDELLDISKIDMGRQPLTLSEMDVRELLYDSIRAVEPAAAGGIAIVPDFPEEPVMVSCDDTRLRRAVTNILSNGVRYARSELRLTCRADRRQVTIRIQDNGDGIAEADLPHIFDRFYMGKSGKSGIGLALTREIIHMHKGTIRAYNGDTGAVFEITLPRGR